MKRMISGLVLVCLVGWCAVASAAQKRQLVGAEREQVEELLHVADHLYRFREYPKAYHYYKRVAEAWPDTTYGKRATKRLKALNKKKTVVFDLENEPKHTASFGHEVP